MKRAVMAIFLGGALVGVVEMFGHRDIMTPAPIYLLSVGILAGALAPDSGFSVEGDLHPWGPWSTSISYIVNIAIYAALGYLILWIIGRARRSARK